MPISYVLELVFRLSSALVLGAILGWDRERHDKPAGIRTHMMVSLGSASFMLLAVQVDGAGPTQIDPTRVIQGIVGGIGFLCAGTIIQSRGHVHGITTAASVWVAGAVGTACGIGSYVAGLLTSVLAVLVLSVIPLIASRWGHKAPEPPSEPPLSADESEPSKQADERERPPTAKPPVS
jgi:putative Mg2+ transporter-C (MgtC) family protein